MTSTDSEGSVTVQLKELETALGIIFAHLRERGVARVTIDEDYYWNIPTEEIYDPIKTPADLNMGQISDDWDRVESIAKGESPAIGYALVWSASVLRRIGELNVG